MNEVFVKTRELGEALRQSPEFLAVKRAEDRVRANARASELMSRMLDLRARLETAMSENKSEWPQLEALRLEMDELQAQADSIEELKQLNEARSVFAELMGKVSALLGFAVSGAMSEEPFEALGSAIHSGARVS